MQRWHLLSRSPHQICLNNGNNGKTKQDLAVQHHQLRNQVQAVQVSLSPLFSTMVVKHRLCLLIQAFKTKCLRKLLRISYMEHKAIDWMRSKITFLISAQEPLLPTVKGWKLAWFRHVIRHDSLSQTILPGTLEGGRRRGRQRKCLMDVIKEWTFLPKLELLTRASCRKCWKRISAESSLLSLRRPNPSRD